MIRTWRNIIFYAIQLVRVLWYTIVTLQNNVKMSLDEINILNSSSNLWKSLHPTSQAPGMEERGKNSGEILWNYPSNPAHGKIDNSWGSLTAKTPQIKIWEERPPAWHQLRLIIFRTGFLAFFSGLQVRKKTHFCKQWCIRGLVTGSTITTKWKQCFCTKKQFFEFKNIHYGPTASCL